MGFLLYTLLLIFFIIPVTLRAYLSLKKGRLPLPYFQNNVVVNRIKLGKAVGILSPIIFWAFHSLFVISTIVMEAWLSVLACLTYMVISPLLSGQIKLKQIGVIRETSAPVSTSGDQS
ncbi:hypothetical protein ACVWWQ_003059 [Rhodanobacter sp. TND4EL1]